MKTKTNINSHIYAALCLEMSSIQWYYWNRKRARELAERAQKISGLKVELSGQLGMRTKFQTFNTAQLTAQITHISRPTTASSEK